MNRFVLVALLLTISFSSMGQTFLVLEKIGTKKRFVFYPESMLDVKIKDDDFYTRITILAFEDSAIVTEKQVIKIEDIREVHFVQNSGMLSAMGKTFIAAGILLFTFDMFNQTVVQGNEYSYSKGVAIASGSLIGLGGTLLIFNTKSRYKLKRRWRVRVAQIY
ncbi:MAG: hypothetical protein ABFS32_08275 [Bacteroidota bacterium]